MSDLRVDYYALEDSERALSSLKSEFDGIEKRHSESSHIYGHDGVKDAMGEFSGNMDYNRRKLSEKIQTVGEKVSNTLETFRSADAELAKSFDESRSGR